MRYLNKISKHKHGSHTHRIVSLHRASLRQVAPLEFPQGGNAARVEG